MSEADNGSTRESKCSRGKAQCSRLEGLGGQRPRIKGTVSWTKARGLNG